MNMKENIDLKKFKFFTFALSKYEDLTATTKKSVILCSRAEKEIFRLICFRIWYEDGSKQNSMEL